MRNGLRLLSYGVKAIAGWLVLQLALTLSSVPRGELFRRLFLVGFGIGILLAIKAKLVGM